MPHLRVNPPDMYPPRRYSQVVVSTGVTQWHIAGTVGFNPDRELVSLTDMRAQTAATMDNLRRTLDALGITPAHVVRINVYTVDMDRFRAGVSNLEVAQSSLAGITGLLRMEERAELADVGNLYVYSSDGRQRIPVREVTTIEQEMRTEKIARRDQFRTITVGAFPVEEFKSAASGAGRSPPRHAAAPGRSRSTPRSTRSRSRSGARHSRRA